MSLLRIEHMRKAFAGLTVVADLSLALDAGERVGLIGPNGAGKTTVFNLISGLYPIDAGSIFIGDVRLDRLAPHKRIHAGVARTFQNIRLMPHLTTLENVVFGQQAWASGVSMLFPLGLAPRNRWRDAAAAELEAFGLGGYADRMVSTLPYGVQKRIEIVRALQARPKLLLLDEPAAGLNSRETGELRDFLFEVSSRGITLFVVEHDMSFVGDLCERVIALNFGEKIAEGRLTEVVRNENVLEAYLGRRHAS